MFYHLTPTPGPTGDAANVKEIEEFWEILITKEIIDLIVECTN